jgi:hypothetical protein
MNPTLAAIESKDLVAMITALLCFGGPFVVLIGLMKHKQRMAELMRTPPSAHIEEEVRSLKSEVNLLRDRLNDVTIKVGSTVSPSVPSVHQPSLGSKENLRGTI